MRARPVILLLLAVVLAGGTALLAHSWLAAQRAKELARAVPKAAAPAPTRAILVARTNIGRGSILRPDELVWQTWPPGAINANYIVQGGPKTPKSFSGWVAINPIAGGEPITLAKIIEPGNRGFLAAVLHPGMRAISVPVNVTSGISGFVFPGDRVDLLLTYPVPTPSGASAHYQHKATETVLRNVRVLAIDQRLQAKKGEALLAHTVTFEVTPRQAEAIAVAQDLPGARLSLSLRPLVAASAHVNPAGQEADASRYVHKISATTIDPPGDAAANGAAGPATAGPADSSIARRATYTLDNDISPLLPKLYRGNSESATGTITILRGTTITSQATTPTNAGGASPAPAKSAEGK